MTISEESRHEMYVRLEEVLGARVAATMMEHLPPVSWADVATKRDLDELGLRFDRDLDALGARVEHQIESLRLDVRSEMRGEINRLLLWLFPSLLTVVGLTFAAARLS